MVRRPSRTIPERIPGGGASDIHAGWGPDRSGARGPRSVHDGVGGAVGVPHAPLFQLLQLALELRDLLLGIGPALHVVLVVEGSGAAVVFVARHADFMALALAAARARDLLAQAGGLLGVPLVGIRVRPGP